MHAKLQQGFVHGLKNAPNLEELYLDEMGAIMLNYMEKLHTAVPRLKALYFLNIDLNGRSEIDSMTAQAATLERLEIMVGVIYNPYDQWFEYFGRKYQQLEEINITEYGWNESAYRPLLVKMLQQIPLLTLIDINIAPLSENMLISSNLTKIGMRADYDMKDLEMLISSAKKSITSLHVVGAYYGCIDEDIWRDRLFRASSVYNLTELTVCVIECDPDTFVYLFNCFPNLKTVDFDRIKVYYPNCQITRPKTTSVIQNLSLSVTMIEGDTLDAISLTLQYVLGACPLLEIFKFKQDKDRFAPQGGIILDMQKHKKLKSFTVVRIHKQYSKFTHIPEKKDKRWKIFYTEVPEDEVEKNYVRQGNEYYLDLA